MNHRTTLAACIVMSAFLSGCDLPSSTAEDFGAAVVAERIRSAQTLCATAGSPDLSDCESLTADTTGARRAARTVHVTYDDFKRGCYEIAGMTKCERLLEEALAGTR